jgi:hypothetical protein
LPAFKHSSTALTKRQHSIKASSQLKASPGGGKQRSRTLPLLEGELVGDVRSHLLKVSDSLLGGLGPLDHCVLLLMMVVVMMRMMVTR